MEKICSDCKQSLERSMFHRCKVFPDGLAYRCKACQKIAGRKHYEQNKDKVKAQAAGWKRDNPERARDIKKRWFLRNREAVMGKLAKWKLDNPDKSAALVAKRRAAQRNATPRWANTFFIQEIYHLAKLRREMVGGKWHVDHIVPLVHPLVCGLHVEHNLAVIPATENNHKSNIRWPQMP